MKGSAANFALTLPVALWIATLPEFITAQEHSPHLLLTAQRLKRLQHDRERQTVRWLNFENRVTTVPDSLERGFELALYYLVTRDQKRGREAIQWALDHPCELRQIALIVNWCDPLVSDEERRKLRSNRCERAARDGRAIATIRDDLFLRIVWGEELPGPHTGKQLEQFGLTDARNLLAACEYIATVRRGQGIDMRQDDAPFFRRLPAEFLLAMKPAELENPKWEQAAAALALVSLDPNLDSSQFLQGWAMEDRQMIREGPGVAYELLWGDPYLPGVSYRNLDPWIYDPAGLLYARTDWNRDACWISISPNRTEDANCPPAWREHPQTFGSMTLIPVTTQCIDVPQVKGREAAILSGLNPHEAVSYLNGKKRVSSEADAAGLWVLPGYIEGKVCRLMMRSDSVPSLATLGLPR
ncbi:MAG: hypothetical protein JOY62_07420 [Acidobacteriaceae bacterium]|nr:hypothetical protein [Acidobacteriaceae bacterium]MBV9779787.1 hypothetical protein [Acidobacteriaceae bacterium]